MSGEKGQALLKALRTELETEGGVLRTTDEYVDALIGYKIRRLVRKHVLAASLLAGAGASTAALLGLLLQALARGPLAKTGGTANLSALTRPSSRERPPAPSDEEEEEAASQASSRGGREGGGGGDGAPRAGAAGGQRPRGNPWGGARMCRRGDTGATGTPSRPTTASRPEAQPGCRPGHSSSMRILHMRELLSYESVFRPPYFVRFLLLSARGLPMR